MRNFSIKQITLLAFYFLGLATHFAHAESASPAAVGWSNLIVPGLGATLRGDPERGLLEAGAEVGTYFGGTFFSHEGAFSIDGSVLVPDGQNIVKPLIGQGLQEFGLKLHMFDTFYNYQQASLAPENEELEAKYQQPLYKGSWSDVLFAPFKWKNMSTAWVYVPIFVSTAYVAYSYKTSKYNVQTYNSSFGQDSLYAFTQNIGVPLGSSFGEEVLFRGFVQREARYYTDSIPLSLLWETVMFAAIHAPELRAGAIIGGIYFGTTVNHFNGNLEPGICSHFWIDFMSAVFNYLSYRKGEGKGVPFSTELSFPL